jgi:uncharacterized protein (DUF111 family)
LEQIIFQHSTSIGVRRYTADRHKLKRESVMVNSPLGPAAAKVLTLPNGEKRLSVEDDDVRSLASSNNTTTTEVRRAVIAAWESENA